MKKGLIFFWLLFYASLAFSQGDYTPLDDRLRNNLYITVSVNKSECYVGEPIVATYKLYSALESESSILKNPSFYGFNYKDLITPRDNVVTRETVDGKRFDVHTIKKVQLMPKETGKLELDALTMGNKIRVLDLSGKKIDLLDGVLEDYTLDGNYLHFTVSSVPITINVLNPGNITRPIQYNGAAGDFKMNVQMNKTTLAPNEQGLLTITIIGKGDFSKVKVPVVQWPSGITALPAQAKNNYTSATGGYKVFGISFSGLTEGSYTIMPIQFSYFDTLNNRFNTITNRPFTFYIRNTNRDNEILPQVTKVINNDDTRNALIIGGGVVLALLLLLLFIRKRKKERAQKYPVAAIINTVGDNTKPVAAGNNIDHYLQSAADTRHHTGNTFYNFLKQGIVRFFEDKFALPSVLFNRTSLKQSMTDNAVNASLQEEVQNLLTEIEMNIYSGGGLDADKTSLLAKARNILGKL